MILRIVEPHRSRIRPWPGCWRFTAPFLFCLSACSDAADSKPSPAAAERAKQRAAAAPQVPLDLHILVDQFGYRPQDKKVAVIRNPKLGFDAISGFEPGSTYEVRDASDHSLAFSGSIKPWNDGEMQDSSGDLGWWFDFSKLDKPGRYYVHDLARKLRSAVFVIDANVYREALKASVRMYFYQRSGFAKQAPFAEACWTDRASYLGPGQDLEARDISDPDNKRKARELSGGWHDAGDNNKYVTFAMHPVHQLLSAYTDHPAAFTDDFNIPESGNGIPDVLDEVKWEIDWLKKMQNPDGSVLLKVGALGHGKGGAPSADTQPRFYVPACTSSTIAAAGMFAHAALVFKGTPKLAVETADLSARAIKSFNAFQSAPEKQADCDREIDGRRVLSGDADVALDEQTQLATLAAVYLFAVTGEKHYQTYVKSHYRSMRPYQDIGWSRYAPQIGQSLLRYAVLPGADAELQQSVLNDKLNDATQGNGVYGANDDDLYRNFLHPEQYHWGSNAIRANYGLSNSDMVRLGLDRDKRESYRTRALDTLHYLHGVNPFGHVYLTNMYAYGATRSVNTTWHGWFHQDTRWSNASTSECGPAPGYLVGGPNANAASDGVPSRLTPPTGQTAQKSFLDWNSNTEAAWAVTECSIGYQASYVQLLSGFVQ